MALSVGYINYLNSYPLFAQLLKEGQYRFIEGVPSALNEKLNRGEIDISPSSSFEYLLHWRDYLVAPNLSISSRRQVESVLLFTSEPLELTVPARVAITGESATSVNLLKVFFYIRQQFVTGDHFPAGFSGRFRHRCSRALRRTLSFFITSPLFLLIPGLFSGRCGLGRTGALFFERDPQPCFLSSQPENSDVSAPP